MCRCDYCEYKKSWDCGDGYYKVKNNNICNDFKLNFDNLSEKEKYNIQKYLIRKDFINHLSEIEW